MKPLIILVAVFFVSKITISFTDLNDRLLAGRVAMAAMLLFTSVGHFKFSKGMAMMLPSIVPARLPAVYITGIFEILAAIGLLVPFAVRTTGVLLIIFFILILPANIYAALKHVNFEKADYSGKGKSYLWFRVPLQLFFIAWVYIFCIEGI